MANKQTIEVVVKDKTSAALGKINQRLSGIEKNTGKMKIGFGGLATAAKGFVAVLGAREIINFGKTIVNTTAEFQNYRNQLRLITDGTEDLNRLFGVLTETAVANRSSFGATVDLFTKLRISTEALGIAEERVINVTSKLSQALQVAGADGNTAASVIRQFGQAMASGEVRGDEFRSLVEGLGPALAIMARESGITVGQLRKMSQAGELTAETMFKMLENSTALSNAFNQMQPTLDQLETALGDAFDRAIVKLGEATGFTKAYETQIKDLTRTMNNFAGTNKLAEMSTDDLFKGVKDGSVPAQDAIQELIARYRDLDNTIRVFGINLDLDFGIEDIIGYNDESKQAIADAVNKLTELEKVVKAEAAAAEKAAKAEQERIDTLNKILKPYQEYINLADGYMKKDFASEEEKIKNKLAETEKVLKQLTKAQTELNDSGHNADGYKDLSEQIAAAGKAQAYYKKQLDEITMSGYDKFLKNLQESVQESIDQKDFEEQAITRISALYRDGAVSLEYYNEAMKQLNMEEKLGIKNKAEIGKQMESLNKKYSVFLDNAVELASIEAMKDLDIYKQALELKLITEKEFAEKKAAINAELNAKILEIEENNAAKIDAMRMRSIEKAIAGNKKLTDFVLSERDREYLQKKGQEERTQGIVADRIDFEKKSELEKTQFGLQQGATFFQGLAAYNKKFFAAYKAFAIAQAIINTYQGATKALATYPPPFNFIAAAATVASGLAQVATIRAQTAQRGGTVIGGQPVAVGEDGPELIVPKQSSTVIPREVADAINNMGGGKQNVTVNFNISTVDAAGFDQLLIERRGTIVGLINQAVERRGRVGVV